MSRLFAFGNDFVREGAVSCECPARQAGFFPDQGDDSTPIAEEYDYFAREWTGERRGYLPEAAAKKAWLATLEQERDRHAESSSADVGEEIAEELGWK